MKGLPSLEAVQKELGEVKKAIEVRLKSRLHVLVLTPSQTYEADLANELAAKRLDAEKAEKARVRNAVDSTKVRHTL